VKNQLYGMRDATNIKLDQLIVHILNPRRPEGLVLSECTIPLEGNQNLVDYFVGHIQNSLKDPTTKAANFVVINDEVISGICKTLLQEQYLFSWDEIPGSDTGKFVDFIKQKYVVNWINGNNIDKLDDYRTIKVIDGNNFLSLILNDEKTQVSLIMDNGRTDKFIVKTENSKLNVYQDCLDLVEGSRKLAQQLYDIIAKDKRINPCDLAVCFYQAENQNCASRYLALLNIEPSEVFRHTRVCDNQGHMYVNFEIETEAMPTIGEKLQKCAFIQQLEPRPEYDMMLLDRQKKGKDVAKFFVKDFMGATLAFDAKQRTSNLYKGLISAHNKIRSELQPHENEFLDQAIQVAIKSDRINIDTWIQGLSLSEKHKQQIEQIVLQKLPDREFEIDKTYAQNLIRKRSFRGDYGLKIVIEASEDKYKKVIKSVEPVEKPGTPPYYRIEIHTEKWEEVP